MAGSSRTLVVCEVRDSETYQFKEGRTRPSMWKLPSSDGGHDCNFPTVCRERIRVGTLFTHSLFYRMCGAMRIASGHALKGRSAGISSRPCEAIRPMPFFTCSALTGSVKARVWFAKHSSNKSKYFPYRSAWWSMGARHTAGLFVSHLIFMFFCLKMNSRRC